MKKVSGWLLRILYPQAKALGASFPTERVLQWLALFVGFLVFMFLSIMLSIPFLHLPHVLILLSLLPICSGCGLVLASICHFLAVVFIRKECFSCPFGFHIIEHEETHLKLNSLDEQLVETETLKQTGRKLFPIILSKPKLCQGCAFRQKEYFEAATAYVEEKKQTSKPRVH